MNKIKYGQQIRLREDTYRRLETCAQAHGLKQVDIANWAVMAMCKQIERGKPIVIEVRPAKPKPKKDPRQIEFPALKKVAK